MSTNLLSIILGAKADQVKSAMNKVGGYIKDVEDRAAQFSKTLKKSFLVVGAAVGAASAAMALGVRHAIKYGIEIDKMAKTTGLSTQAIARLRYVMEQEHASFESLATVIPVLARRMADANDGLETYSKMFRRAGIEIKNSQGELRGTEEVLADFSDFMRSGTSDTEKMAIAQALLGRSGKELIPFLKLGGDEIRKLGEEAEHLGLVLGVKDVTALKHFDDAIVALKAGIRGVFNTIAIEVAPILEKFAKFLVEKMPEIRAKVKELVQTAIDEIPTMLIFADKIYKKLIQMKLGLQLAWETAKTIFTRSIDFFEGLVKVVSGAIERIVIETKISFSFIGAKFREMMDTIEKTFLQKLALVISRVRQYFKGYLPEAVDDGLGKILRSLAGAISEIEVMQTDSFYEFRKNALEKYPDTLKEGMDQLKGIWSDYMETIGPILDDFADVSKDKMSKVGAAVFGFWGMLTTKSQESAESISNNMTDPPAKAKTAWEIALGEIRTAMETFGAQWGSWGQQLGQVAVTVANSVSGALSSAMHTGVMAMIDSSVRFKDAMGQIWKDLKSAILRAITDMIAKWLVFQALTGFGLKIPGLAAGGPTPPSFQKGGEVPAILHVGEYVMPKAMVDLIKRTRVIPAELINAVAEGRPPRAQSFRDGGLVGSGGGIAVQMGGMNISITQQPGESADALLDRMGEMIENRTASGIRFAMKATNAGLERQGEAI